IHLLVRAGELVSRMADQDRPGNQLERAAPDPVAEATRPYVRQHESLVPFFEGCVRGADTTTVVGHRDRSAPQDRRGGHRSRWSTRGDEPEQPVEAPQPSAPPRARGTSSQPYGTAATVPPASRGRRVQAARAS